jgi:hypothetical protein
VAQPIKEQIAPDEDAYIDDPGEGVMRVPRERRDEANTSSYPLRKFRLLRHSALSHVGCRDYSSSEHPSPQNAEFAPVNP